jgi:hypothetical protein
MAISRIQGSTYGDSDAFSGATLLVALRANLTTSDDEHRGAEKHPMPEDSMAART